MTPVPLTSPTGALYGYACGACHQIGSTWETLNDTGAPLPDQVEASREHAAECCVCRTCKGPASSLGTCPKCDSGDAPDYNGMLEAYETEKAEERAEENAVKTDPFRTTVAGVLAELAPYTEGKASFAWWREVFAAIDGWHKQIEEALRSESP